MNMTEHQRSKFVIFSIIGSTLAVSLVCAAAAISGRFYRYSEPEEEKKSEVQTVEFSLPGDKKEKYALPQGAVDVRIDDSRTAFTTASRETAENILTCYLQESFVAPEGERAVSASFLCSVRIVDASGETELLLPEEALELLRSRPSLIPVKVVTEKYSYSERIPGNSTTESKALEEGALLYKQIGRSAVVRTTETQTYICGESYSEPKTETEVVWEGLRTMIVKGTWQPDKDRESDQPGKKEGIRGKSAGSLSFVLPIRTAAESYFGMREGKMHLGIDLPAAVGTEIKAPEEGIVTYIGTRGEYGTVVEITHENGFVSRLTHCKDVQVEMNQRVFRAATVAKLAASEGSKKAHLHYELLIDGIPYNPMYYFSK